MPELPFIRLEHAAAELGVEPTELVDHALNGHLKLALFAEDVPYVEFETEVTDTNGRVERTLSPAHLVPPNRSPYVPSGLYLLPPIAAHHAATRGSAFIEELKSLDDAELYFLAGTHEVRLGDVVIARGEWHRFGASSGSSSSGVPEPPRSRRNAAGPKSSVGVTSQRDAKRLALGADAPLTVREAAELLPGNDAENRAAILASDIKRHHDGGKTGTERKRDLWMVRWGDVLDLFPTVAERAAAETWSDDAGEPTRGPDAPTRPKRRAPKGGLRLADL